MFVLSLMFLAIAVTAILTSTGVGWTTLVALAAIVVSVECMVAYWRRSPRQLR